MLGEPHRAAGRAALEERQRNLVHAVHHATVGPQDDWVRQVDLLDKARVFDDLADRRLLSVAEPVDGVDLPNVAQLDLLNRATSAELQETIDIPGV
jgi:hypothetical protein